MPVEKLNWVLQEDYDTPSFKADFDGIRASLTQYDETQHCADKWCWQVYIGGLSCSRISDTFEEGEAMILKAIPYLQEAHDKIFGG